MLFCFDLKHPQLCLVGISQRLGLHKSTVHRLLSLLKKQGLVVADACSQLYSLGPALVELACVVLRQQDLRALSRPVHTQKGMILSAGGMCSDPARGGSAAVERRLSETN